MADSETRGIGCIDHVFIDPILIQQDENKRLCPHCGNYEITYREQAPRAVITIKDEEMENFVELLYANYTPRQIPKFPKGLHGPYIIPRMPTKKQSYWARLKRRFRGR